MIDFSSLKIEQSPVEAYKQEVLLSNRNTYIIGADPFDMNETRNGVVCNVFKVYDKINMRYTMRMVTKKSFNDAVEIIYKIFNTTPRNQFYVSTKFIKDGKPSINSI
jgi:hypothetical protein